ncbi:MAG: asparagine synthase (glutamine-hydrolyzing) [Phycisphaerales bacterium]|nr:MAG: asparagine synthase (glutamine-hydrolyzing) [Phycisphaerales bacterium]
MCGICGIIRFAPEPIDEDRLYRACRAIRHRGPDHTGTWTARTGKTAIGMGVARLVVIDPSPSANQPMHDPAGRHHLAFNGEVYNFRELRRELLDQGISFVTDSDTEVVLAACAHWGTGALNRFNGMWGLAYFDSTEQAGFLARDRFGIKPLFYCTDRDALLFASELSALVELDDWDRSIDEHALVQHLQAGYIAQPATIYEHARRLEPGHVLRFSASGATGPESYYAPPLTGEPFEPEQYGEACAQARRLLSDAVAVRRVADVPIGAFLSGGLDSSIVVSHLAAATPGRVKTFSVGHAEHRSYDETKFARIVADRFGTEHHELLLTGRDIVATIPDVLDHLGEPVGDSSIIPTAIVSEFASRHVTVALSGDGGDELYAGYWRYIGHDAMDTYLRLPAAIRRLLVEPALHLLSSSKSSSLGNRVRQFQKLLRAGTGDALQRHIAWARILAPEAGDLFLCGECAQECDARTIERARRITERMEGRAALDRILAFDLRYGLPADMLQKVDLASMMHSLEVRVPFLDPAVVAHALASPAAFKLSGGLRKRMLIDAYREHLPDPVLEREKMGFEVPFGEYLRGPLRSLFHDVVDRPTVESFGLLDYGAAQRVFEEHLDRRAEHADLLFALLSLCWWRRKT